MEFHEVPNNRNYIKRMESENGVWEIGLIHRTFGRFAVGFSPVDGAGPIRGGYCCGDDPREIIMIYMLCLAILMKQPETFSESEATKLFPNWEIRPVYNDKKCLETLMRLAEDY